jgi:hypothetical protein
MMNSQISLFLIYALIASLLGFALGLANPDYLTTPSQFLTFVPRATIAKWSDNSTVFPTKIDTTSKPPLPSTVFVTSTPKQSTIQSTTLIYVTPYQNTTQKLNTSPPTSTPLLTNTVRPTSTSTTSTPGPTAIRNFAPALEAFCSPIFFAVAALWFRERVLW